MIDLKRLQRQGFTLIELLVVISIIALLIGILLPALGAARSTAISLQSKQQLRQFGIAFLSYATDNDDFLPSNFPPAGQAFNQPTWLTRGGNSFQWLRNGPQDGTIFDYVGQADELYRSPALEFLGEAAVNTGEGSNGKYDYSTIAAFNVANVADVPGQAEIILPFVDERHSVTTPLLVEEAPDAWMNNGWPDSAHTGGDLLGEWHPNKTGNYTAIDGSTHTLDPSIKQNTGRQPRAEQWYARAPSGSLQSLGNANMVFEGTSNSDNPARIEFDVNEWGRL